MKKTTRRIARTTAALAAALALAAPMTVQPAAEIGTIIAYAATPSSTDLINAIAAHPEDFFEVSSTKNEDGCYSITGFKKPAKYQYVPLTTLTIPAKIGSKVITRVEKPSSQRYGRAICDNDVTSIVISNGIIGLGYDTIVDCPNLRTVTLPSSIQILKYRSFSSCPSLTKIKVSSNLLNFENGFVSGCPNMKDAWSEKAAYLMIKNGMSIMTINDSPIIRDIGADHKPVMSSVLEAALRNNYDLLDGTELMDTYLRIYSRYLLKNTIGINSSMTFNQKVKKIYQYVIPRVTYDHDAFSWEYNSSGGIIGENHGGSQKPYSSGAIFFSNKAVCSGYTKGLNYLFREAGITSYSVHEDDQVRYADGTIHDGGHAFNLLSYNNMFFIVDATCGNSAYLMNIPEEKVGHNVESVYNWEFYTPDDSRIYLDYTKIKYALGDVNGDQRVDNADAPIMREYINASASQKASIAARYNKTKAQMDCLCDADCDGVLNSYKDTLAQWNLQSRFKFR